MPRCAQTRAVSQFKHCATNPIRAPAQPSQEVIMSTHTASFGSVIPHLRSALHRPQTRGSPARAAAAPATPWLERLAAWADRQPLHHRLGSWTRL
jgi:hypothetical protein